MQRRPEGLYVDPEVGKAVSTHSMLKTFRRCPMQTKFKYVDRLQPRATSKPLRKGTWMHLLLETKYKGGDWRAHHKELTAEFNNMFDEEKDFYGDLPAECAHLMRSYEWHYGESDPWIVHEVELTLEADLPDGTLYRGRIDMLVENQWGLWIVDHKNMRTLPDLTFRLLDAASALYIWAAIRNKIPVQGFIWNYLRTNAPSVPQLLKDGSRLSARKISTDYPTLARTIKKYDLDPTPYRAELARLRAQRYQDGHPQTSDFFRRDILEKSPAMLKRVAREALHTSKRMNAYPWHNLDIIERVPDRSCTFSCSYTDICSQSLFNGPDSPGVQNLIRQRYIEGDPMYYYNDDKRPGGDAD